MLPIAPEGRLLVTVAALILAGSHVVFGAAAWPTWILVALVLFVFRNFPRQIPQRALAVVSPVDGVVTEITEHGDPYLDRRALRILIRQHPWGAFNVHSPVEGKVHERWWPGKAGQGSAPPERFAVWVRTDEKDDLVMAVNLEGRLHFVRCAVQSGERMGQGRRCGFLGFGREVEVYLPENCRAEVRPGRRVRAGSDIIATLVHKHSR